jgi:3-hydroxybutyryl-CoA dehydratase
MVHPAPLYFEDVAVGDEWISPSRTVTETDIVMFASMTGDFNRLHVDHEFARQSPFSKPIAHGLLGLAWVAGLGSNSPLMQTDAFLGIDQWRFVRPIIAGETVYVHTTVLEKKDSGRRRGAITWQRKLVRHDGMVMQEGQFASLVAKKNTRAS